MRGIDCVNSVVHLPDGRRIITCSSDGLLRMLDLESGAQLGEDWRDRNNAVQSMALSPNGKTIASGCSDGKVRLWDIETRKVISKWRGHSDRVCTLCWSADGKRVASGSWDGMARVWNVDSGKTVLAIKTGHFRVSAVMYSPDSSKLATCGLWDHIKIWNAQTGKCLKTLLKYDFTVRCLAWTSDGKKLISSSSGPIRIFNTATWQQIAILPTRDVTTISLSLNNCFLASASDDSTARLWNLDTYLPVGPPLQHKDGLPSAVLSHNGKVLVTGCSNRNTYTWDIHAILKKAGLEDLLPIDTNTAPKDKLKQKAPQHDPERQRTPRSSLDDMSFLEAGATRCPDQCDGADELSAAFFAGMEADVDSSPMGGAHSSVNALLALLRRFRPDNSEATEPPQPSKLSAFRPHDLLARLSSFIHRSPPKDDASDRLQQPSTPSRLNLHVLLAHISSHLSRSRLNTDEEAEPNPTTPMSSHSNALISWLSPTFRSRPHTNEGIALPQHPFCPPVVEVAAVRDKQTLVVARGPQFKKAKQAYEQKIQSRGQAQASSHTQPTDASASAIPPAPVTSTAQPLPLWNQIILFLCCASQ
ncbi:WD40 repeat-like protein [Suillus decipiens]|nr:WD40 repeat-like protein [Suillus decipiens]